MLPFILLVASLLVAATGSPINETQSPHRAQLITKCTVPKTVALTFDDGPYIYLNSLIDLLDANNAKGTFFFSIANSPFLTSSVQRVKYAYERGHQIGSHTWSHEDLTTLNRNQNAIRNITGAVPAFMRPPYGNYNNLVLDVVGARGQAAAIWDFDSEDSIGASPEEQKRSLDNALRKKPNTILYNVLPYYIQKLKAAGYRMVTVAECVGKMPYIRVGQPSVRDVCPFRQLYFLLVTGFNFIFQV
ncbi:carbohydrate esterase family 4 protein [Cyathus striatus]|nr:carbohydrate esterase family 4 protein [Cyathus striatus]